jgi:gliding motility-associated-like protein
MNPFYSKFSRLVCGIILSILSLNVYGQNQVAKVTPDGTWYYEYLPADYNNNTDDYPIMFFFHGLGERGNNESDLTKVAKNGPPLHVKNGTDFPFILISPQLKTNLGNWPPNYMDEVVEHIFASDLRIDLNRVYITGLSLGGGGAWFYAQRFPEKITAVAPVCGSRNNTSEACNIAAENIPVWAFHGDADGTVSVNKTINMIDAINACTPAIDPTARITIYEGVGHNSWSRAYRTDNSLHDPNIYQWFMSHSKSSLSVSAGNDRTINLPTNTVNLTATINAAAAISTRLWTKVSGPSGASLSNTTTNTLTVSNLVAGIYTFRFTATDANGASAADDVKVTVVNSNSSPTANAGNDLQIQLPTNSATINGSGSDSDGTISSYSWIKTSGGTATLSNATTANLNVTGLVQGNYTFELTVTDDDGATASDEMNLQVLAAANASPTANAGPDKNIQLPANTVNLNGTGSDTDGTIATYLWEKFSGGSVTLSNTSTATATATNLTAGIYEFKLTVTDDDGASASDRVKVTVSAANQVPTITISNNPINITLPTSSTTLSATANDPDGSIASRLWEQQSGPSSSSIANPNNLTTIVSGLSSVGEYVFSLTVTDDQGASNSETVSVIVAAEEVNTPPTVSAGEDKFITLPTNSISLTGTASDADGTITEVRWSKVAGPAVNLAGVTTYQLDLTGMVEGSYRFRFRATDDDGDQNTDIVEVIVAPEEVNAVPTVSAGADVELTLPENTADITATASDSDGTIASYLWSQVSGPGGITIAGADSPTLMLSDLVEGVFEFSIAVTDDDGAQSTDQVLITVYAQNVPPTVNAGNDITITLPLDSAEVSGSASDSDGEIASYLWEQLSGPSTATIVFPDSSLLKVTDLVSGNYTFKLSATDDDGDVSSDNLKITVNEPDNESPVVSAGTDKTIQLPVNSLNLQATESDSDGTIASRQWQQISGPTAATLTNANTRTVTVSDLVEGSYTFEFMATDDDGAQGVDDVMVVVQAEAQNQPPVVTVGETQSLTLPTNSTVLEGSASDADGTIASYSWVKFSGPDATLTNENTSNLTLTNLVAGSYVFRLTATDDDGASANANVQVFVLPETVNQSPVANAGDNKLILLPQNITTIVGGGTDNDGTIVSYSWEQISGPNLTLQNTDNSTLTVSDLVEGVCDFKLTVTDDDGAISSDEMTLTISNEAVNIPPNADAGPDLSTILPINTLVINGSGSDQDGQVVSYSWTKVSGPSVSLSNTSTTTLNTSNLVEGVYVFQLKVTDDDGATDTDRVNVNVFSAETNQSPTVDAGADQSIQLPDNSITLTGTANDADGSITSVIWEKVSGGTATLANESTLNLELSDLVAGNYVFRLTAEDDDGVSVSDETNLSVLEEEANLPPTVNAGPDISIQLPDNSVTITPTVSDPDGDALTYRWAKESGPSVSITGENSLTVSLTELVEGSYLFKFTATDPDGERGIDRVIIDVLSEEILQPPIVNAGPLTTVQLPEDEAILSGEVASDGTIVSVEWEQISGPAPAILSNVNTLNLTVKGLIEGTYNYRLSAVDDQGQSAFDETEIIVYPEEEVDIPQPPTLELDNDILVQLPQEVIEVNALANSPDGLITNYVWEQLTGPSELSISPDSAANIEVTNFITGAYYLRLTVFDALDSTVSKITRITVLEEEELARPRRIFSPNNDGIDDVWNIEGAEELTDCTVRIINSRGKVLFSSVGYNDGWDGRDKLGQPVPEGMYYYIIDCPDKKAALSGVITIIR